MQFRYRHSELDPASGTVVGVAGQHRPGTVQLLRKQDARQAVGQGQIRQRPDEVSPPAAVLRNTIRATDDKAQVSSLGLPGRQSPGQGKNAFLCGLCVSVV